MDNIDWWAVLNAPGNEHQQQPGQQRHDRAQQISVANLTQGYGQESPPAHLIASLYPQHGRADPSPTPPNSAFSQSSVDPWPQRQDAQVQNSHADLLSYLSHQSSSSEHHPYAPNPTNPNSSQGLLHPTPQQGDTAFQGLPDWLFPPAISSQQVPAQAQSFPAASVPPPQWKPYAQPRAQPQQDRSTYDPGGYPQDEPRSQSVRVRSRGTSVHDRGSWLISAGTSPSLTPNISHRSSPGPQNTNARYAAHSPTQLQEVTSADLNSLGSNGSNYSARPQPSRSASSNGGIEPEDAEDKRSRNTQACE